MKKNPPPDPEKAKLDQALANAMFVDKIIISVQPSNPPQVNIEGYRVTKDMTTGLDQGAPLDNATVFQILGMVVMNLVAHHGLAQQAQPVPQMLRLAN